jgi:hypothetical protein
MVKQMLHVGVSCDSDGATLITCRGEADFHTELSGMAITGDVVIALSPSAEGRTTLVTRVAEGGPR